MNLIDLCIERPILTLMLILSLLVFGLLAAVMLLTRKLDWYGLAKPAA